MHTVNVNLFKATDAEDAFAIHLPGDAEGQWRAERGFGSDFQKVWTVEFQSDNEPGRWHTDWDQVLGRAVEAYSMNDPVITNFHWPAVGVEV
jgi:hypothetical protein